MHLFQYFSLLASTFCFYASLSAQDFQASEASKPFLLQAKVISNSKTKQFDGLYVYPFHTGAGTNAAALGENARAYPKAYMSHNGVLFDYNSDNNSTYQMKFQTFDRSEGWGYVTINVGANEEHQHFHVDKGFLSFAGAEHFAKRMFAPWRVCLWNHGVPELFFNNIASDNKADIYVIPSDCELVQLKMVFS